MSMKNHQKHRLDPSLMTQWFWADAKAKAMWDVLVDIATEWLALTGNLVSFRVGHQNLGFPIITLHITNDLFLCFPLLAVDDSSESETASEEDDDSDSDAPRRKKKKKNDKYVVPSIMLFSINPRSLTSHNLTEPPLSFKSRKKKKPPPKKRAPPKGRPKAKPKPKAKRKARNSDDSDKEVKIKKPKAKVCFFIYIWMVMVLSLPHRFCVHWIFFVTRHHLNERNQAQILMHLHQEEQGAGG